MSRRDEIKLAYKNLGGAHSFYDGMMTGSSLLGRVVLHMVWRMNRDEALEYQAMAFESIPSDFSGKLLEVPVGTGVISLPIWKTLPNADITCLDYSESMMDTARNRSYEMGISNITFMQGDVGRLPFEDGSFDIVISLNGFHAFPDKEAAYNETYRVLKEGGTFCGCFYIKGENLQTDKMIRRFYIKRGFFTKPFETIDSLRVRLKKYYQKVEVRNMESIAVFSCVK